MKFPNIHFLVIDTETTGFVPGLHRVIEFACMVIKNGKITEEYEQLISAEGDEIPPHVQVMTQIHPEDLTGKPAFGEIFEKLETFITKDVVLVGQNAKYDVAMLRGEGLDLTDVPVIDTAMLASMVFPEIKSYSLSYLCMVLGLSHTPKHRALGDVRATASLLSACFQRLSELPASDRLKLMELASRGPAGYQRFFEAVNVDVKGKAGRPEWLSKTKTKETKPVEKTLEIASPKPGVIQLFEENLDSSFVSSVVAGAGARDWIALKNLDASLRRMPDFPRSTVMVSPDQIISREAAEKFLNQEKFTDDELTLAIKIWLYHPETRSDLPLHGEEYQLWSGKLAGNSENPEYIKRLNKAKTGPVLISHYEILQLLKSESDIVPSDVRIVVEDASILEDTASQALGWLCLLPTLRAASVGDELLTKCADLVELWTEKTRNGQDQKYLAENDLETLEASQLKRIVQEMLDGGQVPHAPKRALSDLMKILDPNNLPGRITWIETFIDGTKSVRSVPENISKELEQILYRRFPVTLIIPKGAEETLSPIIPSDAEVAVIPDQSGTPEARISFPLNLGIADVIGSPSGKTVILVGSKRTIEDVYVKHFEQAETAGITLLCQGFSGGQSRMQAEFSAAESPATMVVTPWMYETMELPPGTVDRLIIQTLPFDHPAHAVFSRRGQRYKNAFSDYAFPRLRNRLFRLFRTFLRHSKSGGTIQILDDRLRTKPYGKELTAYLTSLLSEKRVSPENGKQMPLFR